MNLSKDYKMVLKHFNTINKNMYFVKGNIQSTIIGTNAGPVMIVRYSSLEEIPESFAVADLGTIISIFDMFSEFDLNINEKKLVISSEKKHVNITLTKKEFIQYAKTPEKYNKPEGVTFDFKEEVIDEILKLSSVLKTPHIFFEGKDGNLFLGTEDCSNPTTDSSKYDLGSLQSDRNFKYVVDKENLRLMKNSYKLIIPEKKFIYLTNDDENNKLEYFITLNSNLSR